MTGATANRGKLRLKTVSIREIDESLDAAVDMNVSVGKLVFSHRLSVQDGTPELTEIFNAEVLAGSGVGAATTARLNLLNLSVSNIEGTLSIASGSVMTNVLSVGAVSSFLSVGDSLGVIANRVSVQRATVFDNLTIRSTPAGNALSVGGRTTLSGDMLLLTNADSDLVTHGTLSVNKRSTFGGALDVEAAATGSNDVTIGDNLSVNQNLTVNGDVTIGDAGGSPSLISMGGALVVDKTLHVVSADGAQNIIENGLSISGDFFASGDEHLQGDLSVGGTTVLAAGLSVGKDGLNSRTATFDTHLSVSGDGYINQELVVNQDLRGHAQLSVAGYGVINSLSVATHLTGNVLSVQTARVTDDLNVGSDVVIGGNLTVKELTILGTSETVTTTQVQIVDPIIEVGYQDSATQPAAGIKIKKTTADDDPQAGIIRHAPNGGTAAYFALYEDFGSSALATPDAVGDLRVQNLSTSGLMVVKESLSIGQGVVLDGVTAGPTGLSVNNAVTIGSTLSVGNEADFNNLIRVEKTLSVSEDVTVSSGISVGEAVTIASGGLSVQGGIVLTGGTFKAEGVNFTVEDMVIGGHLSVASDIHIGSNGTGFVGEALTVHDTTTLRDTLSVGGAARFADTLSIGDSTVILKRGGTGSTDGTTGEFVFDSLWIESSHTLTLDPLATGEPTENDKLIQFHKEPEKITLNLDDGSELIFTGPESDEGKGLTTGFVPHPEIEGNFLMAIAYKDELSNEVSTGLQGRTVLSMDIQLKSPFVTKDDFRIFFFTSATDLHNTAEGVDAFTPNSGFFPPTLSTAGQVIVDGVLSVNNAFVCNGKARFESALFAVEMAAGLSVNEQGYFNKGLIVTGTDDTTLSVGTNAIVNHDLSVGRAAIIENTLSVGTTAIISGAVTLEQTLSVSSTSSFGELMTVGKDSMNVETDVALSVAATAIVSGVLSAGALVSHSKLSVGGDIYAQSLSTNELTTTTLLVTDVVASTLSVTSGMKVDGFVKMGDGLSVASDTTIGGELSVGLGALFGTGDGVRFSADGNAFIYGSLSVNMRSDFQGGINVNSTTDGITLPSGAPITGELSTLSVKKVKVKESLSTGGTIYGAQRLSVSNLVLTAAGLLSVGGNVNTTGELSIGGGIVCGEGGVTAGGPLSVGQSMVVSESISVGHNTAVHTISGDLSVAACVFQPMNLEVSGRDENTLSIGVHNLTVGIDTHTIRLSVGGEVVISDTLSVGDELHVNSSAFFGKGLEVLGDGGGTILHTTLSVGESTALEGSVEMGDTLSVMGLTTLADALSVAGTMHVDSDTVLGATLSVSGLTTLGDVLSAGGAMHVVSFAELGSTLSVGSDITTSGAISVHLEMHVESATELGATLSVSGLTTLGDALSAAGAMHVVSFAELGSTLSVGSDITTSGAISVSGVATLATTLSVADATFLQSQGDGKFSLTDLADEENNPLNALSFLLAYPHTVAIHSPAGIYTEKSLPSYDDDGLLIGFTSTAFKQNVEEGGQNFGTLDFFTFSDITLAAGRVCLTQTTEMNAVDGGKILLNGLDVYNASRTYGMYETVYTITGVPQEHPIRVVTDSSDFITAYSSVAITQDGSTYYYGDVTVTVTGDFGTASIECGNHGYMGMENALVYDLRCTGYNAPEPRLVYLSAADVTVTSQKQSGDKVTHTIDDPAGKVAPHLSLGGSMSVFEKLSVGMEVTVAGALSVHGSIHGLSLSVQAVTVTALSTHEIFVGGGTLDNLIAKTLSVGTALVGDATITDGLSLGSFLEFEGLTCKLSCAGQIIVPNGISVGASSYIENARSLSIQSTFLEIVETDGQESITGMVITPRLSVNELFVKTIVNQDPGSDFTFDDDAVFEGDMKIKGKLQVTEVFFTGGGQITGGSQIFPTLSVANLYLAQDTVANANNSGHAGLFKLDQQYLYVCVATNTWRRVALSDF